MNPKVSIVIPVYNGSNYLADAIDSALAQTYNNIEVLVINDGSKDQGATEKIAKSYGNKIRYFYKENGGVASALNMGIEKMKGEYFSWLSHDDMYSTNKVKAQIDYLNKLKKKDAILFSNYYVLEGDEKNKIMLNSETFDTKPKYKLLRGCINGNTVLIPKSILLKYNGFNVDLRAVQDYDLWMKIIKDYEFIHMKDYLVTTRLHQEQDSVRSPIIEKESSMIWIKLIEMLDDSEKIKYEGSTYNYYIEMIKFLKSVTSYSGAIEYCREKLKKEESKILNKYKSIKTKVTIFTPTFNRSEYIEETIKSVLSQTSNDYKYLIIDDGSTDNTNNVVQKYTKDRNNLFYIYQDNHGEAKTVNRGWDICDSEYFVQLNSDDLALPDLIKEMTKVLDKNKNYIVGYPDFYIIDKYSKIIDDEKNSDFDFIKDLGMFSCYAACAGSFIRKESLKKWKKIRNTDYKYISDIDMYWRMALSGDFLHIPLYLASWRSHENGISDNRHMSIPEIEKWTEEFFSTKGLPEKVKKIENTTRSSIYSHFARLIDKSGLDDSEGLANYYRQKATMPISRYVNLQVGDNDLIGNKFNGHDLHKYLRTRNIESYHLVLNKQSDDPNTYILGGDKWDRDSIIQTSAYNQIRYDLNNLLNPLMYDIIYNKLFLASDVVHLHLMHNGILDLNTLPLMSKLKPVVWTLHDTWSVLSDEDSRNEEYLFPSEMKNFKLNNEIKKISLHNSDIVFIAASKYMKSIIEKSPLYKGKKIFHVPFGLNLDIFYPQNKTEVRKELGFGENENIVILRGNIRNTKGLDYIEYVMRRIGKKHDIRFLVVGGNDLEGIPEDIKINNYCWVNDDELMAKLFSAADLLLMPSTREAFGMMAIEAMACGTVPVVIEGTALPETVNSPHCGIATERNYIEYCNTVESLIVDKLKREKLRRSSIDYIRENHSIEKYITAIEEVYSYAITNHIKDSSDLLNEIRKHNETSPRLRIADSPYLGNSSYKSRIKRALKKTYNSILNNGFKITISKIIVKLRTRLLKKLFKRLNKEEYYQLNKVIYYYKQHGARITLKKVFNKIRSIK